MNFDLKRIILWAYSVQFKSCIKNKYKVNVMSDVSRQDHDLF